VRIDAEGEPNVIVPREGLGYLGSYAGPLQVGDVINMVELVETTVRLKQPRLAFPSEITAHAPRATRKFHAGGLGTWITETLSSWNLA
jgi:hypothetical protein